MCIYLFLRKYLWNIVNKKCPGIGTKLSDYWKKVSEYWVFVRGQIKLIIKNISGMRSLIGYKLMESKARDDRLTYLLYGEIFLANINEYMAYDMPHIQLVLDASNVLILLFQFPILSFTHSPLRYMCNWQKDLLLRFVKNKKFQ